MISKRPLSFRTFLSVATSAAAVRLCPAARRLTLSASLLIPLFMFLFMFMAPTAMAAGEEEMDETDWYLEFATGVSVVPVQKLRSGATGIARMESDTGFFVGAGLGTDRFDFVRVELRLNYREVGIDKAAGLTPATTDGEMSLLSVMANGYYDFDLGIGIVPYLGAGMGYGLMAFDFNQKTRGVFDVDDKDHVFVYNFMLGGRIPITKVSEISLGYRYVGVEGTDSIGTVTGGVQQDLRGEFEAHEITAGLRYNF